MTTEHMRSAALRVVGHDDADGGVENPFDLDRREPLGEPWWQRIRENRAFCVDVIEEGPADPDVVDDYEIPRLGKTHARSGMRGEQDPLEDLRGDRLASELPPDVAATMDDLIYAVRACGLACDARSGPECRQVRGRASHSGHCSYLFVGAAHRATRA